MTTPHSQPQLHIVTGAAIADHIADLARLRIRVFRDWPYLYLGDENYEAGYLRVYADSAESLLVLVRDGEAVVGASTGLPLGDEGDAFQAPLREAGLDPDTVFYCGESVLLAAYRGRGFGHAFFDARETHARRLGRFTHTAFAAVERPDSDPRRPPHHRDNIRFWESRGYRRHPGLTMHLPWQEAGHGTVNHTLTYWLRPLES